MPLQTYADYGGRLEPARNILEGLQTGANIAQLRNRQKQSERNYLLAQQEVDQRGKALTLEEAQRTLEGKKFDREEQKRIGESIAPMLRILANTKDPQEFMRVGRTLGPSIGAKFGQSGQPELEALWHGNWIAEYEQAQKDPGRIPGLMEQVSTLYKSMNPEGKWEPKTEEEAIRLKTAGMADKNSLRATEARTAEGRLEIERKRLELLRDKEKRYGEKPGPKGLTVAEAQKEVERLEGTEPGSEDYNRLQRALAVIDRAAGSIPAEAGPSVTGLPEGVTEADVQFTMQKYKVTRDEVLRRIQKGK